MAGAKNAFPAEIARDATEMMSVHFRATAGLFFRTARMLLASACLVPAMFVATSARAQGGVDLPASVRPLTGVELYMLYHNKSWIWPDGAAFFRSEGRDFIASTGTGRDAQWAEGRWIATDDGRLCLVAEWHGSYGVIPKKTCFLHKADRGTIYQRREPDGEWSIFKHVVPRETDEFSKLIPGDAVSTVWAKVRAVIEMDKSDGTKAKSAEGTDPLQ